MDRRLPAACAALLAAATVGACSGGDAAAPASLGARVFADSGCGSCHTFAPAGSTGTAGPSLDDAQTTPRAAEAVIRRGATGMPAYADGLSPADLAAVARFVSGR